MLPCERLGIVARSGGVPLSGILRSLIQGELFEFFLQLIGHLLDLLHRSSKSSEVHQGGFVGPGFTKTLKGCTQRVVLRVAYVLVLRTLSSRDVGRNDEVLILADDPEGHPGLVVHAPHDVCHLRQILTSARHSFKLEFIIHRMRQRRKCT